MGELDEITNARFAEYDYEKGPEKKLEKKVKGTLKKYRRGSQKKILGWRQIIIFVYYALIHQ